MSNRSKRGFTFFSKIDIQEIFTSHCKTLKNYKQNSYSTADILIFFVFPSVLSFVVVFADFRLNKEVVGILINVSAIFAGLLFNLLVLIFDVISKAVKQVDSFQENILTLDRLEEISSNVSFEIVLSILNLLLLVISVAFFEGIPNIVFSFVVFYLVTLFTLTLFMILKRVHKLLAEEIKHQRKVLANNSSSQGNQSP